MTSLFLAGTQYDTDTVSRRTDIASSGAVLIWLEQGQSPTPEQFSDVVCGLYSERRIFLAGDQAPWVQPTVQLIANNCNVLGHCRELAEAAELVGAILKHHPGRFCCAHAFAGKEILEKAESPLEVRLGLHLLCEESGYFKPQVETVVEGKRYRIDFAFVQEDWRPNYKIAVEVDGHDFHERTKEQARRDRSRDRAMTSAGWHVLRFTGSEVWRDAARCASEVTRLIERLETQTTEGAAQ